MNFSDINYNLYKSFIKVYETKNISQASKLLFISQPAVTHNIKELENQLNTKLFNKKINGSFPTKEADVLYKHVINGFNSIRLGEISISELDELKTGEIRIGCPSHIAVIFLSSLIKKFKEKHNNINFIIFSSSTKDLVLQLENGNIDLLVDSLPLYSDHKSAVIIELSSFSECFIGNKDYVDENKIYTRHDILKLPLIVPIGGSNTYNILNKTLKSQTNLKAQIECTTTDLMLDCVIKGMGVGYVPEPTVKNLLSTNEYTILKTDFELPKTEICLMYIDGRTTKASSAFIEILKEN